MNRKLAWQGGCAVLVGILAGFSSSMYSSTSSSDLLWSAVMLLLAALASIVVVPLEPHGFFILSPVVYVVSTRAFGIDVGLVSAILAPFLAQLATYRSSPREQGFLDAAATGGEHALALAMAAVATWLLVGSVAGPTRGVKATGDLILLSALDLSLLFAIQAFRVSFLEGVRLRRLLLPLLANAWPHLVAVLVSTVVVWTVFSMIGPFGILLTTVVVVELYYPWKLLGDQRDLFLKSLLMISNAVDLKDPYTAHHSKRVSSYAVRMARVLNTPEKEVQRIRIGALMHDIGKMAVPTRIIRKPARLTDEEMEVMKQHVEAGATIVEELEILNQSVGIVRHHHENFDGTGYPASLAGDSIPIGARMVFVADAFDALTTDRPYRRGRTHEEALKVLEANTGTQFDPVLVDALKKVLRSAGSAGFPPTL